MAEEFHLLLMFGDSILNRKRHELSFVGVWRSSKDNRQDLYLMTTVMKL